MYTHVQVNLVKGDLICNCFKMNCIEPEYKTTFIIYQLFVFSLPIFSIMPNSYDTFVLVPICTCSDLYMWRVVELLFNQVFEKGNKVYFCLAVLDGFLPFKVCPIKI